VFAAGNILSKTTFGCMQKKLKLMHCISHALQVG